MGYCSLVVCLAIGEKLYISIIPRKDFLMEMFAVVVFVLLDLAVIAVWLYEKCQRGSTLPLARQSTMMTVMFVSVMILTAQFVIHSSSFIVMSAGFIVFVAGDFKFLLGTHDRLRQVLVIIGAFVFLSSVVVLFS